MSHLSKIRTKIQNQRILQKTLTDLGIKWHLKSNIVDQNINSDIIIESKNVPIKLTWNKNMYELIIDTQLWKESLPVSSFIDKIHHKYSYNLIMQESRKHGFTKTNEINYNNGNTKIILQKWSH